MVKFEWSAAPLLLFILFETLGVLLFTSLGIAAIALTPNVVVAAIISGAPVMVRPRHSRTLSQTNAEAGRGSIDNIAVDTRCFWCLHNHVGA